MQDLPRNTEAARLKLRGSQQRLTVPASAALFTVNEDRIPAGEYFVESIDREKHVWFLVDFSGRLSFAVYSRDALPFA